MDAEARLEGFIARFSDKVAGEARAAVARMRQILPGATVLVYDNYNALAIAFGASEKASDIVFSVAVYPRWASLFFARGAGLDDAQGLLKGEGSTVRHIVIDDLALFDDPRVRDLMDLAMVDVPFLKDPTPPGRVVIKSVSAKQRPRRPT